MYVQTSTIKNMVLTPYNLKVVCLKVTKPEFEKMRAETIGFSIIILYNLIIYIL